MARRGGLLLLGSWCLLAAGSVSATDARVENLRAETAGRSTSASACAGHRSALPQSLLYELEGGAFPGSGRPDVGVHVPPGFDATNRPGLVVYFHGWNGCVQAALGDREVPCREGGEARAPSHLASQLDEAGVNALLVAVELRADAATGETGQLAAAGGLRALLRELFEAHLGADLGAPGPPCVLPVDAFQHVMLVAHSGGYQAAASALAMGDLPQVTDMVLLDALYGADEVFASWAREAMDGLGRSRRFVDLYTCCGGTLERSRTLAGLIGPAPGATGELGPLRRRRRGRARSFHAPAPGGLQAGPPPARSAARGLLCRPSRRSGIPQDHPAVRRQVTSCEPCRTFDRRIHEPPKT